MRNVNIGKLVQATAKKIGLPVSKGPVDDAPYIVIGDIQTPAIEERVGKIVFVPYEVSGPVQQMRGMLITNIDVPGTNLCLQFHGFYRHFWQGLTPTHEVGQIHYRIVLKSPEDSRIEASQGEISEA